MTAIDERDVERFARAICIAAGYEPEQWADNDDLRNRCMKYARVALQALSPGSTGETDGWQPIETAPKDGSAMLLYGHGVLRSGGVYAKGHHVGWSQVARDGNIYWATRDPAVDCEPTHWRPLPEPPSAMLAAAGGRDATR